MNGPSGSHDKTRGGYQAGTIVTPMLAGTDSLRSILIPGKLSNSNMPHAIMVAGYADNAGDTSIAIARYYQDGELDTSFDTDGKLIFNPTVSGDLLHALGTGGTSNNPVNSVYFAGRGGTNNVNWLVGKISQLSGLDTSFYTVGYRLGSFDNNDEIFRATLGKTQVSEFIAGGYMWWYGRYNFMMAAFQSDGNLDTSFNTAGFNMSPLSTYDNGILSISMDTNNAGARSYPVGAGPTFNGTDWDFGFARYHSNGALDTGFSTDGKLTLPVLSSNDKNYAVYVSRGPAVNIHGIYSGGYAYNGASNDFALIKLRGTGSLDTGFHTDGKVTLDISGRDDVVFAITGDSLIDKFYAVGSTNVGTHLDVAVARYDSLGFLDTSFDTDGYATFDVAGQDDVGASIVLPTHGGTFQIGARASVGGNQEFAVLRVQSNGTLAASGQKALSFGTNGAFVLDLGGNDVATAVSHNAFTANSNASILWHFLNVMGRSGNDIGFVRANGARGVMDTSFDTDGMKTFDLGVTEEINGVSQDTSTTFGPPVAVGSNGTDFLVIRFTGQTGTTATLDTTFATSGWMAVDFSGSDVAYLASFGRIVVGNEGSNPTKIAALRFTTDGYLDTSFHTDGKETYSPSGSNAVGKFVAQGTQVSFVAGNDANDFVVLKLGTDGTLSTSFFTDGMGTIDFGGNETLGGAFLDTRSSARPSMTLVGGNGSDWVIARVLTNGSFDTSFNTNGKLTIDFGGPNEIARGVQVTHWGDKIFVGGDNGTDFLFVRLHSSGVFDTTFDTDGKQSFDVLNNDVMYGLTIMEHGTVCGVGSTNNGVDFGIACLNQ